MPKTQGERHWMTYRSRLLRLSSSGTRVDKLPVLQRSVSMATQNNKYG